MRSGTQRIRSAGCEYFNDGSHSTVMGINSAIHQRQILHILISRADAEKKMILACS
jgi:hypothetical protein